MLSRVNDDRLGLCYLRFSTRHETSACGVVAGEFTFLAARASEAFLSSSVGQSFLSRALSSKAYTICYPHYSTIKVFPFACFVRSLAVSNERHLNQQLHIVLELRNKVN